MKKSTVVIISSLCTLVVCLGMFCLYLIFNNSLQKEYYAPQERNEITYTYMRAGSVFLHPKNSTTDLKESEYAKSINEKELRDIFSEILESGTLKYKINPNINYKIELRRDTDALFVILFKSDTEELSYEVCDFVVDEFCEKVENNTEFRCLIVDAVH